MTENGKVVVLMSYNRVSGFAPGVHGDGKVAVYSFDRPRHQDRRCKQAAKDITDKFYDDFDLRRDADQFEHIFVYAGLNAAEEAVRAARMIGHDIKGYENGKRVTLVACHCEEAMKRRVAHDSYSVNLIICECGGEDTMGRIAQQVIEGVDPKSIGDYARLN